MNLQVSTDAPAILQVAAAATLVLHISGGAVGMASGAVSMLARKGAWLHRSAGNVFFVAMLTTSGIASVVSPMLNEDQWTNTTAAVFTFYLTLTAWLTVKRREGQVGRIEAFTVVAPLGIALMGLILALVNARYPAATDFATVYAFSAVAALAAVCDFRMLRSGGSRGVDRIARHVWRISLALFVATGSFFFGQPKFVPELMRDTILPAVLGVAPLAFMIFWLIRIRAPSALGSRAVAGVVCAFVAVACALEVRPAEAAGYRPPRTSTGAPDLQGIWTNSAVTFLQRPPIFKNLIPTDAEAAMMEGGFASMVGDLISTKPIDPNAPAPKVIKEVDNSDFIEMDMRMARIDGQRRTSWIIEPADGRIPFTEAGRKAARTTDRDTYEGPEARPLTERCLIAIGSPEGPPMMNTAFNAHYQIVQTRDHIAIHVEMNHDVRIIRMIDRTHVPSAIRPWMGDSVGWWDGDTLVVETTNFNPQRADVGSLGGGFAFSAEGKLTERFTRKAKDLMLYEFTVEDAVNFKQSWRAEMPMRAAKGPIYEYACHEGNYSLPNALTGARFEERATAPAKAP